MNLAEMLKNDWFASVATATVATPATHDRRTTPTVAKVATVAVANPTEIKTVRGAVNDDGPQLSQLSQPQTPASNDPAALPPAPAPVEPPDWAALDKAYMAHHLSCPACIAAGKGYGLRCGTGAALWGSYDVADKPLPVRAQPAPATPQPVATDSPPALAAPTEQEAGRTAKRLALFAARGVKGDEAQALAQRLLVRDREGDRRWVCAECRQLVGSGPGRWRCGDNSHHNVNELAGAWVGAAFVRLRLHRCGGFSGIQHL